MAEEPCPDTNDSEQGDAGRQMPLYSGRCRPGFSFVQCTLPCCCAAEAQNCTGCLRAHCCIVFCASQHFWACHMSIPMAAPDRISLLRAASATEVKCEGSGEAPQSARREGPTRAFPGGVAMPLTPTVAPPCLPSQDSLDSCRSADSNMPRWKLVFLWQSIPSCRPGKSQHIQTLTRHVSTSIRS